MNPTPFPLPRLGRKHKTTAKGPKGLPTSRRLKRLGKHAQLVEYRKPKTKPAWLNPQDFDALSETLVVRERRFTIKEPGCRTKVITVVTTLLDPVCYPARDSAER